MKLFSKKFGFTIIEMLVVIAIIVIVSGVMIVNFRKGESGNRLQRSAQQIAQNIRKVQNMAASSVEYQDEVPPGGYGIRFRTADPKFYRLCADIDNSGDCGDAELMEQPIYLETDIEIYSLLTDSTSRNVIHITFVPPDPATNFSPAGASNTVTIGIRKQGAACPSSDCRSVRVGRAGWVSID